MLFRSGRPIVLSRAADSNWSRACCHHALHLPPETNVILFKPHGKPPCVTRGGQVTADKHGKDSKATETWKLSPWVGKSNLRHGSAGENMECRHAQKGHSVNHYCTAEHAVEDSAILIASPTGTRSRSQQLAMNSGIPDRRSGETSVRDVKKPRLWVGVQPKANPGGNAGTATACFRGNSRQDPEWKMSGNARLNRLERTQVWSTMCVSFSMQGMISCVFGHACVASGLTPLEGGEGVQKITGDWRPGHKAERNEGGTRWGHGAVRARSGRIAV